MDIFTQKRLLIRMVVLLTGLNLLLMFVFLLKGRPEKPPPPAQTGDFRDVSGILRKELNLTEDQADQIRELRIEFFKREEALSALMRSERDSINAAMFNKNTDEELVKSLAKRVAENGYRMEMLRFEQAQQLKTICTPEQLEKFEGLIKEIRDYFRQDNKPARRK